MDYLDIIRKKDVLFYFKNNPSNTYDLFLELIYKLDVSDSVIFLKQVRPFFLEDKGKYFFLVDGKIDGWQNAIIDRGYNLDNIDEMVKWYRKYSTNKKKLNHIICIEDFIEDMSDIDHLNNYLFENELDWVSDLFVSMSPGDMFEDSDICNDDSCKVSVLNDKIIYRLTVSELLEEFFSDDDWPFEVMLRNNGEVDANDYDNYVDSNDFDYLGYLIYDHILIELTDRFKKLDPNFNLSDYVDDEKFSYLGDDYSDNLPGLHKIWSSLVNNVLNSVLYFREKNAYESLSLYYENIISSLNIKMETYFEVVTIEIPMENVIELNKSFYDLTTLLNYYMKPIADISWVDRYWDGKSNDGCEPEVNMYLKKFLEEFDELYEEGVKEINENEDNWLEKSFNDEIYMNTGNFFKKNDICQGIDKFNEDDCSVLITSDTLKFRLPFNTWIKEFCPDLYSSGFHIVKEFIYNIKITDGLNLDVEDFSQIFVEYLTNEQKSKINNILHKLDDHSDASYFSKDEEYFFYYLENKLPGFERVWREFVEELLYKVSQNDDYNRFKRTKKKFFDIVKESGFSIKESRNESVLIEVPMKKVYENGFTDLTSILTYISNYIDSFDFYHYFYETEDLYLLDYSFYEDVDKSIDVFEKNMSKLFDDYKIK
jgi:hypothetical protein